MNPEQQQIAIAEFCGWKQTHIMQMGPKGKYVRTYQKGRGKLHQKLPNYLNDLNACAEFEAMLTDDELWEYSKLLMDYRQAANGFPLASRSEVLKLQKATTRQRAEAFLRTLNLWVE